jgi:predicted ATPase/DNA-binding NarL/FixJ family response regulator
MVDPRSRQAPGRLIGRERELALLVSGLAGSRLVTISGLGGVGKTSLAREVAARPEGSGGRSIFVDLAPVAEPREVVAAIATAVGAAEEQDRDLLEAIAVVLADAPSLMVLDNFEHVLAAGREVRALLDAVPTLRVLTTSRVRLDLPGESEIAVGSLGVPTSAKDLETAPASALFLERAGERNGLPRLEPADADAIVEICRRLDGLPLAIELAAAWSGILTPRAILRRLTAGRLDLSGSEPRHASLDAVIASTLELVEPSDRGLFPLLSVFSDAFDEAAARAITTDERVLNALRNLIRVALVRVRPDGNGEPRFDLLETIRAFGLLRLAESGRIAEVQRRHATYYADLGVAGADRIRTTSFSDRRGGAVLADPNVQTAFERSLDLHEPELAIRLAASLATYAMQTGILRQALARLDTAMALQGGSAGVRADGLNALVSVRGALRQMPDLADLSADAVALARVADDPIRIVRTLITLGNWTDGDRSEAYAEAAELAERVGYTWGAATAWSSLADAHWTNGRTDEALVAMGLALAASERDGDRTGIGMSLMALGEYELNLGRIADGLAHLEEAATILRSNPGMPSFVTATLALLASAQALAGQVQPAYRTLAEATERVEAAEPGSDVEDWLAAAALVLEPRHPVAAARALGALDRIRSDTGLGRVSEGLQKAVAGRIEHSIGRPRYDRSRADGRAADGLTTFAELARLVRREAGPDAGRLRAPFGDLTSRERQILAKLAEGRTDREIAADLGIAAKTASVHVANVKSKLGVETRVEAVLFARDRLGSGES